MLSITNKDLNNLSNRERQERIEKLLNFAEKSGKCRRVKPDLDNYEYQEVKTTKKLKSGKDDSQFGNNPEDY